MFAVFKTDVGLLQGNGLGRLLLAGVQPADVPSTLTRLQEVSCELGALLLAGDSRLSGQLTVHGIGMDRMLFLFVVSGCPAGGMLVGTARETGVCSTGGDCMS